MNNIFNKLIIYSKANFKFTFLFFLLLSSLLSSCKQEKKNPPSIASISPLIGTILGGTTVTINGADFVLGAKVSIGSNTCSIIDISTTHITCKTTATSTGLYQVSVTNPNRQNGNFSSAFRFSNGPTITSIFPNEDTIAGGSTITITGSSFDDTTTISIGGVACINPILISQTVINCLTAARVAGTFDVVVTNVDSFSAIKINGFIYRAAPTISSVSASAGALAGGTAVAIFGTGFYTGSTVTFDGVTCTTPVVVSATSMTCTTPAHIAGAVNVVVTNADTQTGTGTNFYTYQLAPSVGSILPVSGPLAGLTILTITGTDFISGATVKVGGVTCSIPIVNSLTNIQCTAPAHSAGSVNIVVTNADTQTGTSFGQYIYIKQRQQ